MVRILRTVVLTAQECAVMVYATAALRHGHHVQQIAHHQCKFVETASAGKVGGLVGLSHDIPE